MFQIFTAKKAKGDGLVRSISKMRYSNSIKNHNILSNMLQLVKIRDLKRTDKIAFPAGMHAPLGEGLTEVIDTDYIPVEGTDHGIVIFEVSTAVVESTMGEKGVTFSTRLTNVDASTPDQILLNWDSKMNEEYFLFVPEGMRDGMVLLLNDCILVPAIKAADVDSGPRTIGKEQLRLFSEKRSTTEGGGKDSTVSVKRDKDIRKSLAVLRKTEEPRLSELVLQEGGLKLNCWYLERLASASSAHYLGGADAADDKWNGISYFIGASDLRILRNREAFQNFAVLGTWDEDKHGKLLNMFLSVNEKVEDESESQLISISTSMQTVLQIAHGLHWNSVFERFVTKLRNGKVGRLCPPHTKSQMDEAWTACARTLNDDSNDASLLIEGAKKCYKMDNNHSVVEMVSDRFNAIPETDFSSITRFQQSQKETAAKTKPSSKKHDLEESEEITETTTHPKKPKLSKKKSTSVCIKDSGNEDHAGSHEPSLCIFNLSHQLLKSKDCNKGEACDRVHYCKSLVESDDYHWTEKTISAEVRKVKPFIISLIGVEKEKLLNAVKKEFANKA